MPVSRRCGSGGWKKVKGEMTWGAWYWVCLFLFLVFGGWWGFITPPPGRWAVGGWSLMVLILFIILGIASFGGPVKG